MPIISGAFKLGGALLASKKNKDAAETAAQGQRDAANIQTQYLREAQEKQLGFAREGQDYLKGYRDEMEPGQSYLRGMVADPGHLTPAQLQQLTDLRRSSQNQISTSSLAGSGRTTAALLKRVESDFTNDALDRNRNRADSAARDMAGRSGQAAMGVGNISVGTGAQQAALSGQIGAAQGAGTANSATALAQGDLASGKMWSQTLGDIGGTLANMGRGSRYLDMV